MDDIDTLLDVVEERYLTVNSNVLTASKNNDVSHRRNRKANEELTDIIDDICSATDTLEYHGPIIENDNHFCGPTINNETKCFAIHLSGSSVAVGLSDVGNQRPCSTLRCVGCDFKVIHFDDCEWDSTTDYLFLRNNMPESAKLRKRLVSRKGCRAYACQCSWKNVFQTTDVNKETNLKWICGKH